MGKEVKLKKAKEFIEGIKQLDQNSSWAVIAEYLFFDVKKEAEFDITKIKEKKTLEDYGVSMDYVDGEYLKNLLRYKIATKKNLYTVRFDCDKTILVKEFLEQLIKPNVESISYNKNCTEGEFTINDYIKLESDTVNSFVTTFNHFMREMILTYIEPNWLQIYKDCFNLAKGSEPFRDLYFLKNVDNWKRKLKKEDKEIWLKFEAFAKLSHSLGNFTLVPITYNVNRNTKTKDYWDLTMLDMKKMATDNDTLEERAQEIVQNKKIKYKEDEIIKSLRWYFDNYNLFYSSHGYVKDTSTVELKDNDPILFYGGHSFKKRLPTKKEMPECLESIIKYILLRGLDMIQDINPKLKENEAILKQYNNLRNENLVVDSEFLINNILKSETS